MYSMTKKKTIRTNQKRKYHMKREIDNPSKNASDPQTNPNFEEQFNALTVYLFDWNHEV